MKKSILFLSFFLAGLLLVGCAQNDAVKLANEKISFKLSINEKGIPYIKKAHWTDNKNIIFSGNSSGISLNDYVPENLVGNQENQNQRGLIWNKTKDSISVKAQLTRKFNDLDVKWNYQLYRKTSVLQTWVELENNGADTKIPWFPIWAGALDFKAKENLLKYWDALEYTPHQKQLTSDSIYTLQSNVYSSDPQYGPAQLPWWKISSKHHSVYFGIGWCGGWETKIRPENQSAQFNVTLPPEETQLIVKKGEVICGPKLSITPVRNSEDIPSRTRYFTQKQQYAHMLYDMPKSHFPLIYNHWYATRFNLNGDFIIDQLKTLKNYHFDVFVVDAGWYKSVGDWYPDRKKFKSGEFESALKEVKDHGIEVGIWSCPWLVSGKKGSLPQGIDTSGFYREFVDAYAIDMAKSDFTSYLLDHIGHLQTDYQMDWWKYDQEFMKKNDDAGRIKNIKALQDALKAVRKKYPGLYIENCMSGGRMINELTNTLAQIHWIRDGGHNGLSHARENIKTALGASEILPISKVQRWTNRINEIKEPELLKYYCRSAMIGVWGISANMYKVSPAQKDIILQQVEHYRQINELKADNVYQIIHPDKGDIAAITYYNASRDKAAVMVFRWTQQGQIRRNITLDLLNNNNEYYIEKVSTNQVNQYSGSRLRNDGWPITLEKRSMSAIYYIEEKK